MNAQTRGGWASRFGFVMATAGSAVGLGNIWKFPYMTGANGGGAFLIIYLICVLVFGLSLLIAELTMGRMSQRNPVGAFHRLAGGAWPLVGGLGVITATVILSFYIVVAGWAIAYLVYALSGSLVQTDAAQLNSLFGHLVGAPVTPLLYATLFMAATAMVVAGGIAGGIERMSRLFMPLLFLILALLVLRAVTLPGAGAGLAFFLEPDWGSVDVGTVSAALGQAFFSLSLGVGGMITYGSYMSPRQNIGRDAMMVVVLDTLIAIMAGLMILPAMMAAGMTPSAGGPGTTFKVLPAVFAAMPAGGLFGVGFFLLLVLAALTSSVSLLEPVVSFLVDERDMKRATATGIGSLACLALAIPVSLSFGMWHGFTIAGKTIFGAMDFFASNLSLPLGSLLTAVCLGWVVGRPALAELSNHGRVAAPWAPVWLFFVRFIAPFGIAWILIQGLIGG